MRPPPASGGSALFYSYLVLLDTDDDSTTGCDLSTMLPGTAGLPQGFEKLVTISVDTSGAFDPNSPVAVPRGPFVSGVSVSTCASGVLGQKTAVSPGGWDVGGGNGVGGSYVIEAFVPLSMLGLSARARLVFYATQSGSINPFGLSNVGSFSRPAAADIDIDGDLDLFVGTGAGDILFFENGGGATSRPSRRRWRTPLVSPTWARGARRC